MGIVDYIAIAAIALAVGGAIFYIVRSKKRGDKCIGCPYSRECCGKCADKREESGNRKTQNEEK